MPDVKKTPNLHYWYLFIKTFTTKLLNKWADKYVPEKKEEDDDDFDPFAEDD